MKIMPQSRFCRIHPDITYLVPCSDRSWIMTLACTRISPKMSSLPNTHPLTPATTLSLGCISDPSSYIKHRFNWDRRRYEKRWFHAVLFSSSKSDKKTYWNYLKFMKLLKSVTPSSSPHLFIAKTCKGCAQKRGPFQMGRRNSARCMRKNPGQTAGNSLWKSCDCLAWNISWWYLILSSWNKAEKDCSLSPSLRKVRIQKRPLPLKGVCADIQGFAM